ncbi:MAG: hypothetical protein GY804_09305 [Alphaproteobacteria bacterium]|nr:hypothetical protein [Alphaproteobacteria bacterium]
MHFFNLYISSSNTDESSNSYIEDRKKWIDNPEGMYETLSTQHKIIYLVRQSVMHYYCQNIIDVYHISGSTIFTDYGHELEHMWSRLKHNDNIRREHLKDYFEEAETLKNLFKYINQKNEYPERRTIDIRDAMGFFLDHNNSSVFIPDVSSFKHIYPIISFVLYNSWEYAYEESDREIPCCTFLYPYYFNNTVIMMTSVLYNDATELRRLSPRFNRKHSVAFNLLLSYDLATTHFNKIMGVLASVAIINDRYVATPFQQICVSINNHIMQLCHKPSSSICPQVMIPYIPPRAFGVFLSFIKELKNTYGVCAPDHKLILSMMQNSSRPIRELGNLFIRKVEKRHLLQTDEVTLRASGLLDIFPQKSSYNLIRLNAAGDDLEGDLDDPDEGGIDDDDDSDIDATDDTSTTDDAEGEPDGADEVEEPSDTSKAAFKVGKTTIEIALSDGKLNLHEYFIRQQCVERINEIIRNPGNLPGELISQLKYFRTRWLYLLSVPTLEQILGEIDRRIK